MDEYGNQQDLPVDETEIQARLIEPESGIEGNKKAINRNLQLGNVRRIRDLWWLQSLEETRQVIDNIPDSQGKQVFSKWADDYSERKNHFLALTGSHYGFVREMMRTTIQKQDVKQQSQKLGGFFGKKKPRDEY